MNTLAELLHALECDAALPAAIELGAVLALPLPAARLPHAAHVLARSQAHLAGIVCEQRNGGFALRYPFWLPRGLPWLELVIDVAPGGTVPSISPRLFAADWHEREIEDLFGLIFSNHPFLGNFVLHDEVWPEQAFPMRHDFAATDADGAPSPYQPQQMLQAEGAFLMPVGPVYGGVSEAGQFLLDTLGEEITHCQTRLFYKYRGIEKRAEGMVAADALLLVERMNGTNAFAHALAAAQAIERACDCSVPARAQTLRSFWAELERLRSHAATIAGLCKSTALAVPTSLAYQRVEELLRLSGRHAGHRYLFGLIATGGLAFDLDDAAARELAAQAQAVARRLADLAEELLFDNSFIDRLEEVGVIDAKVAQRYGLVGPVGRAAGHVSDLRREQPYAAYAECTPRVAQAAEGDNLARLRVFLDEAAESARLLPLLATRLPAGTVRGACATRAGAGLGWTEAPAGASTCFARLDADGRIARLRLMPPAFANWHAYHLAAERFAFQDFPITLASFGLSMAEQDR